MLDNQWIQVISHTLEVLFFWEMCVISKQSSRSKAAWCVQATVAKISETFSCWALDIFFPWLLARVLNASYSTFQKMKFTDCGGYVYLLYVPRLTRNNNDDVEKKRIPSNLKPKMDAGTKRSEWRVQPNDKIMIAALFPWLFHNKMRWIKTDKHINKHNSNRILERLIRMHVCYVLDLND